MPLNIMQKDPSIPFFFAGILVGLSTILAYNLMLPKVKLLQKEVPHIYTNITERLEEKEQEKRFYKEEQDINEESDDSNFNDNSFTDSEEEDDEDEIENGYTEESQSLLTLLYSIAEDQARKEGYIHRSIICNNCGEQIQGFRYKCTNCVDYDLCETCEALGVHYITHVFLKIRISIPPLANPRSALLPIFYPGNDFISKTLDEKQLQRLHLKTHFDIVELEAFYDQYNSLSTFEGEGGGITHNTFELCLGPLSLEKNLIIERLFRFFDQNHDGVINFEELVCGLSILCKGSLDERIKHTFIGYDLDEDGKISRSELHKMLTAYFKLSMNLVRDVVKIMEEGIMENFDDEASKPVSSVFAAPIPSSNNNFDEKEKKEKGGYGDDGSIEDEYSEINVSTGDLNISYEKAKEKTKLTNEIIYENAEDKLYIADADINKIKKKLNFEDEIEENKNEINASSNNKKNNVSIIISPTSTNNNNSAIASSSTSAPTSSNPYNRLKQKRSSIQLSSITPSSADTSSALQTQANLITKINKKHHYETLRRSNNLPIMEAMSQDTIEEVVNKTFSLANAKSNDYLTFEEFQRVAESDITILAWFEALGSVF
ncbi:EF-hand [Piromyces finnis]|uniref:EF-hand n=1 Tax=Piromyces finnis TaxID=1754191 RepID=A0A1Y1VHG0_9FUNG|nr:EF-hand [Piromyces finnis]|eukprot:ORX56479.1 EF-hand [Piromyces finnis]